MSRYPSIRYRAGYKYQLADDYEVDTGITLTFDGGVWVARLGDVVANLPWVKFDLTLPQPYVIGNHFFRMTEDGHLFIKADYAWDGPSPPAIDTKNFRRGSLEHDMLYQAMREGLLPPEFKPIADERLYIVTQQDGMWQIRAWCDKLGLGIGGKKATEPRINEVLTAP